MKRLKVLQMPIGNAGGGITRYALENWRCIDKSRFRFDFVTRSPVLDFSEELAATGAKIHHLSCSSMENEKRFLNEMESILDDDYHVVHLHTSYWNGLLAEKLAMERGCPMVIIHAHSTMIDSADASERRRLLRRHERLKSEFSRGMATHFWACTRAAGEWLFSDRIAPDEIVIMNNAVDSDKFAYNRAKRDEIRRELGLVDAFILGHAGRFVYQKNHEFLLSVFKKVCLKIPRARLVLAGDGPLRKKVEKLVAARKIRDKVVFLGKYDKMEDLLQSFDVYLQPSRFEGLSIVLLEAQAAGLRCLASDGLARETKVTPGFSFLPLEADLWASEVERLTDGYPREEFSASFPPAATLKEQIKVIERHYLHGCG